jgi:hypothetical protein
MKESPTEAQRRRAIAWAIALTANTTLAPEQYEWDLLEQYALGKLKLNRVLDLLNKRVHHVLYCSHATQPFTQAQLTDLLEQSRAWNRQHQVTGLLSYTHDGRIVQLLEGPVEAVHALYSRIRQDARHYKVETLSDQAGSKRWFPDWRMAFTYTTPNDFAWLLSFLETRSQQGDAMPPTVPITQPHLLTLLRAFSEMQPAIRAIPLRPWPSLNEWRFLNE